MLKLLPLPLAILLLSSCVIQPGATPQVQMGLDTLSSETHRGMVQSESPVLSAHTLLILPAREQGTILISSEGSAELSDDTGDAWRPDGQSGRFARYDWSVLYGQQLGQTSLTFGLISYNLPNGREFMLGPRGSTTEVMLEASTRAFGLTPRLRLNYDVDEVDGLYLQLGASKEIILDDKFDLNIDLGLAWMDEDQAFWNYAQAPASSGLADLRLTSRLNYQVDQHTRVGFGVGASEVIDSEFQDWFDLIGIDTFQVWASLGVEWSY